MSQELKQTAYQLLIDKITVNEFEQYLFKSVEGEIELQSNSLLFDFVNINYKSGNYKKQLFRFLENFCSEEELLSLKIYSLCMKLLSFEKQNVIIGVINEMSSLFNFNDYDYEILYEFYLLNSMILPDGYNYYHLTKEQVVINAKLYAKEVIIKFNFYKRSEDWYKFLNCSITIKKENAKKIMISNYTNQKNEGLVWKLSYLIKGILGLR